MNRGKPVSVKHSHLVTGYFMCIILLVKEWPAGIKHYYHYLTM